MKRTFMLGLLLAGLGATACNRDTAALAPEDRQFVETMVALRRAAQTAGEGGYDAAKAAVLREHGVSEEQLRVYLERRAGDLNRLAAVWESINVRLSDPAPEPE